MLWVNSCITGPAPSPVLSIRHILSSFRALSLFWNFYFVRFIFGHDGFVSETTCARVWRVCMSHRCGVLFQNMRGGRGIIIMMSNSDNNNNNIRTDAVCLWTAVCADTSTYLIRLVFAPHVNEEHNCLHLPRCVLSCSRQQRTILQQIGNTLECK